MPDDGGLLAVDSFFRTGIPGSTVLPVEHILLYDNARQVWPTLLQSYRGMSEHLDRLERSLQDERQAARAVEDEYVAVLAELNAQPTYRCRRRLQPLVRLLLKPSHT